MRSVLTALLLLFKTELVLWGNIMNDIDFEQCYKRFSKTLKIARKVSVLGAYRKSTGFQMTFACILFARMCVIAQSIQRLTQQDVPTKYVLENWDYASTFGLTRNLMECYHSLFYLCFDNVSNEERQTRKNIFDLHDYYSRKQLFEHLNEVPLATQFHHDKENCLEFILDKIQQDSFFNSLPEKERNRYLQGKNAFMLSREDIEERSGFNKREFRLWYKLLSANVHSFPMGFYHVAPGERGLGVKTELEVKYICKALSLSESYLRKGIEGMITAIYPDIRERLDNKELRFLKI